MFSLALILALAFEFINGFHDTANAVATVIYTQTLKPVTAIIWSGLWNFIGALTSNGAVAFAILALLPALGQLPGDSTAMAMILSVLVSAIVWNFATWYLGLPVSSSHTLIGSILGVEVAAANLLPEMASHGIEWGKAHGVLLALLISPLIGFIGSFALLLLARKLIPVPGIYRTPEAGARPPRWMRGVLVFTSAGVSFAHGSNDGQKGMGLILLILLIFFPAHYAADVIPVWVKALTAATLALGTMIGWKRIVVTLGEKIGKQHMTYAQGAAAELITMGTILSAGAAGLPVSTTHVLSSGIAGTMVASGSGLQPRTLRNILLAWILTLPVSILLGAGAMTAGLFCLFQKII
jgi:PiT family inorganic phosphate transporter